MPQKKHLRPFKFYEMNPKSSKAKMAVEFFEWHGFFVEIKKIKRMGKIDCQSVIYNNIN